MRAGATCSSSRCLLKSCTRTPARPAVPAERTPVPAPALRLPVPALPVRAPRLPVLLLLHGRGACTKRSARRSDLPRRRMEERIPRPFAQSPRRPVLQRARVRARGPVHVPSGAVALAGVPVRVLSRVPVRVLSHVPFRAPAPAREHAPPPLRSDVPVRGDAPPRVRVDVPVREDALILRHAAARDRGGAPVPPPVPGRAPLPVGAPARVAARAGPLA